MILYLTFGIYWQTATFKKWIKEYHGWRMQNSFHRHLCWAS